MAQIRPLANKIFYSSKATMSNMWAFYLNYVLTYDGVPKIQDCVVVLWKRHVAEKIFIYVKAPMHINSHTKFQLPLSITSWDMTWGGPKIKDGVAVVRTRHLAAKISTLVKLQCLWSLRVMALYEYVYAYDYDNHMYSRTKFQLSNSITSLPAICTGVLLPLA